MKFHALFVIFPSFMFFESVLPFFVTFVQLEAATPEKDRLASQRVMDQYRRDLESLGHDMDSEKNRQLADLQVTLQHIIFTHVMYLRCLIHLLKSEVAYYWRVLRPPGIMVPTLEMAISIYIYI